MTAYYNEHDPDAVAVLREFIACGYIAPGIVDSRSIKDVTANDLKGFAQVHLFAGAGLWSVGARLAGWPDSRPLWTASCPCQGESLAGKRLGADDPRHLWPDVYRILGGAIAGGFAPPVIVGEQVAAAAGTHWLDRVCADLAEQEYAARAVDIPACAVDAPHQRQRLWWLALADAENDAQRLRLSQSAGEERLEPTDSDVANTEGRQRRRDEPERGPQERAADRRPNARDRCHPFCATFDVCHRPDDCDANDCWLARNPDRDPGGWTEAERDGLLADAHEPIVQRQPPAGQLRGHEQDGRAGEGHDSGSIGNGDVDHAERARRQGLGRHVDGGRELGRGPDPDSGPRKEQAAPRSTAAPDDRDGEGHSGALANTVRAGRDATALGGIRSGEESARTRHGDPAGLYEFLGNGSSWYADAEWIICHDGKARRAKPSIPMLVNGMVGRISLWSLAGNSINPVLASEIFAALLDAEKEIG